MTALGGWETGAPPTYHYKFPDLALLIKRSDATTGMGAEEANRH